MVIANLIYEVSDQINVYLTVYYLNFKLSRSRTFSFRLHLCSLRTTSTPYSAPLLPFLLLFLVVKDSLHNYCCEWEGFGLGSRTAAKYNSPEPDLLQQRWFWLQILKHIYIPNCGIYRKKIKYEYKSQVLLLYTWCVFPTIIIKQSWWLTVCYSSVGIIYAWYEYSV